MQNQMQPPMMRGGAEFGPPSLRNILRNQAPGTVIDLETGLPPVRPPLSNLKNIGVGAMAPDKFMPGGGMRLPDYERYKEGEPVEPQPNLLGRPRRLPQIIPERMPSRRPTPRFFGGGLGSIFSRLLNQRARERMSPPLPRAPLPIPMPERMPMERFPMMRPGFAEGEGVDINRIIADQGAREGISPAERRAESLKNFLRQSGRNISERDAELFGMGILSFEDVMRKVESARQTNLANEQRQNALADQGRTLSNMDRNLMQQEQMFFPESRPTDQRLNRMISAGRGTASSLDDILEDLEKKN